MDGIAFARIADAARPGCVLFQDLQLQLLPLIFRRGAWVLVAEDNVEVVIPRALAEVRQDLQDRGESRVAAEEGYVSLGRWDSREVGIGVAVLRDALEEFGEVMAATVTLELGRRWELAGRLEVMATDDGLHQAREARP